MSAVKLQHTGAEVSFDNVDGVSAVTALWPDLALSLRVVGPRLLTGAAEIEAFRMMACKQILEIFRDRQNLPRR